MKKFLLVCLLGLGLLLPTTTITAKEHFSKRVINVGIEGFVLLANSDKSDGPISLMEVRSMLDGKVVAAQKSADYTASLDISGLPSGYYVVRVYAEFKTYEKQFKK